MTNKELLQSLFYDLLRDCAPAGEIEVAVQTFEEFCNGRFKNSTEIIYSNKHLAEYASELAERIINGLDKHSE